MEGPGRKGTEKVAELEAAGLKPIPSGERDRSSRGVLWSPGGRISNSSGDYYASANESRRPDRTSPRQADFDFGANRGLCAELTTRLKNTSQAREG